MLQALAQSVTISLASSFFYSQHFSEGGGGRENQALLYFHVNYFPWEFQLERHFWSKKYRLGGWNEGFGRKTEGVCAEEITVFLGGGVGDVMVVVTSGNVCR